MPGKLRFVSNVLIFMAAFLWAAGLIFRIDLYGLGLIMGAVGVLVQCSLELKPIIMNVFGRKQPKA